MGKPVLKPTADRMEPRQSPAQDPVPLAPSKLPNIRLSVQRTGRLAQQQMASRNNAMSAEYVPWGRHNAGAWDCAADT